MKIFALCFMLSICLPVFCVAQKSDAIKERELYYLRLSMNLNDSLKLSSMLSGKVMAGRKQDFQKSFDQIFSFLENNPSELVTSRVYDNIILFHNASVDREVTLSQQIRYTDKRTRQMSETKDSLLTLLGKQYELPFALRKNVKKLEIQTEEIETTVLKRLKNENEHFMALSVELVRQVHNVTAKAQSPKSIPSIKYSANRTIK